MTGRPFLFLVLTLFALCWGQPELSYSDQYRDLWQKTKDETPIWPSITTSNIRMNTDFMGFLTSNMLLPQKQQEETVPAIKPTISYGDATENSVTVRSMKSKAYPNNVERRAQPETCSLCLRAMNILRYGDVSSWIPSLEEKCNGATENSPGICENLVSTFRSLAQHAKNSTERDICNSVKLCEPSWVEEGVQQDYCQQCLSVMSMLLSMMQYNESLHGLKDVLGGFCGLIKGQLRTDCYYLLSAAGIIGFQKLVKSTTSDYICWWLDICYTHRMKTTDIPVLPGRKKTSLIFRTENVPFQFSMTLNKFLDQLRNGKKENEKFYKEGDGRGSSNPSMVFKPFKLLM